MCKRLTQWFVLMLWSFPAIAFATNDASNPLLTGTVNIVLANPNGIVVVTDSNQTYKLGDELFTYTLPGQKLFRIDERTVCTIAGFGSKPLPRFSQINSSAAGVLDSYVEQLGRTGATHSFHEKFTSLFFFVSLSIDQRRQSAAPQCRTEWRLWF